MKNFIFLIFILKFVLSSQYIQNNENFFELVQEEEMKFSKVEDIVNEYLHNPKQFISTHNNRDNFIVIFSNFTKLNGEVLYQEYLDQIEGKNIQSIIDRINKIKNNHLTKWEYDISKAKFVLPSDSKIFFKSS